MTTMMMPIRPNRSVKANQRNRITMQPQVRVCQSEMMMRRKRMVQKTILKQKWMLHLVKGSVHNLRPRRKVAYSHFHINFEEMKVEHAEEQTKGVEQQPARDEAVEDKPLATSQMSMKRGIKLFGDEGVKAVTDDLQQLHDREVMKAKYSQELTWEQP